LKLTNSAQMREMDNYVIEELNIAGTYLMENASKLVAAVVLERLVPNGNVAVFCGVGNNGGDGIGAAAFLKDKDVNVRVFMVGNLGNISDESIEMCKRFELVSGIVEPFENSDEIEKYIQSCSVIVDAIFGIGLNSIVSGEQLKAINMINSARACVISVDIPSGVHSDMGTVLGNAVWADITITFSMAKPGHFIEPGCMHCGEVRVHDIGIPRDVIDRAISPAFAVTSDEVVLPRRRPDAHKGNFGRCLIAAGSLGYTGAPSLAARAATAMGAGLVYLGVPNRIYDILALKLEEEMPFPLADDGYGRFGKSAAYELIGRADACDAVLLGPGMGGCADITKLVLEVIGKVKTPIILDADGLNAIADHTYILGKAAGPLILTPHIGEYLRIGGDISSGDRLRSAREFAHKHGCILVLKGHRTITALPDGTAYINTTGGPAMAKGGCGDVLAGMIASLVGQKFPLKKAVTNAVYLHGLAGDMCAAEMGEYSVTASDIIKMLPKAVLRVIHTEQLHCRMV